MQSYVSLDASGNKSHELGWAPKLSMFNTVGEGTITGEANQMFFASITGPNIVSYFLSLAC